MDETGKCPRCGKDMARAVAMLGPEIVQVHETAHRREDVDQEVRGCVEAVYAALRTACTDAVGNKSPNPTGRAAFRHLLGIMGMERYLTK